MQAYPQGFRVRRGWNWVSLGLLYAAYYMCRYNFRQAGPELRAEFHFTYSDITQIQACWFWAYGVGQLVNGLFTDRIGGKRAMLIGAVGTIAMNLLFGAASFAGGFATFAGIWLINGYFQAFGAPGMIKINASWFSRTERGTFAGIFGFMIQLGQFAINKLGPMLLAGFTIFLWTVPKLHWRWVFWVPTVVVAAVATLVAFVVRDTPDQAGYHVHAEEKEGEAGVYVSLKEAFGTIVRHPLVWFYALAYACTGAVRHGSDHLAVLYFVDELKLSRQAAAVQWTLQLMPLVAVVGAFSAGIISDKLFKGHRSPVAMGMYFLETVIIIAAVCLVRTAGIASVGLSCAFLVLISLTANSTHSIIGTAAAMDVGGRRMAGFASGVIDSFQYFGAGIALPLMGMLLDKFGWSAWFPAMAGFGCLGGCAMLVVMRKQGLLRRAN